MQVVWSWRRGSRSIEHIGSAHNEVELAALKTAAAARLAAGQTELDLGLSDGLEPGTLPITSSQMTHLWDGLCTAYRVLGFDSVTKGDTVFRDLVLARIIEPTANATASRLVYSMARDGHLPKVFATVGGKHKVPVNAMVMIAALALAIGIFGVGQAGLLTTLVTFGALLSYILMHFSVVNHFARRSHSRRWFTHVISPLLGAAILMVALWDADANAKIVGTAWLTIGVAVGGYLRWRGRSLQVAEA